MRIAVIIASAGRADCIAHVMQDLRRQTQAPARIVLAVPGERDLPPLHARSGAEVVLAQRGLPAQRNAGLDHLGQDCDVVVFFDDDFVPSRRAIAGIARLFADHPAVAGATGLVLADGIKTPGIPHARAQTSVAAHDRGHAPPVHALHDGGIGLGRPMLARPELGFKVGVRSAEACRRSEQSHGEKIVIGRQRRQRR